MSLHSMRQVVGGIAASAVLVMGAQVSRAELVFEAGDPSFDSALENVGTNEFTPSEQQWHYSSSGAEELNIGTGGDGSRMEYDGNNDRLRGFGYFFDDDAETTGGVNLQFTYSSTDPDGEIGVAFYGSNDISTPADAWDFAGNDSTTVVFAIDPANAFTDGTLLANATFVPGDTSGADTLFNMDFDLGATPFNTVGMVVFVQGFDEPQAVTFDNFAIAPVAAQVPEPHGITMWSLVSAAFACSVFARRKLATRGRSEQRGHD